MVLRAFTAESFGEEGSRIMGNAAFVSGETFVRRFRAFFGVPPRICATLWDLVSHQVPLSSQPCHLLWALLFLKMYASEHVNATLTCCDEKTFRKWVWVFVTAISNLCLIKWDDRLSGREGEEYKASVDGVDFCIEEPSPFDPCWFSHKFKGPGVRYEVGVGISSGNIVWAHGPFPCGSFPDLKIYKLKLKSMLMVNEKMVADSGYVDSSTAYGELNFEDGNWGYVRARHEVVNKRLKQFMVMSRRFRHRLSRRSDCFYAVLNITYLLTRDDSPVFQ